MISDPGSGHGPEIAAGRYPQFAGSGGGIYPPFCTRQYDLDLPLNLRRHNHKVRRNQHAAKSVDATECRQSTLLAAVLSFLSTLARYFASWMYAQTAASRCRAAADMGKYADIPFITAVLLTRVRRAVIIHLR